MNNNELKNKSISHGTMVTSDLLEAFMSFLEQHRVGIHDSLRSAMWGWGLEENDYETWADEHPDRASSFLNEEVWEAMNDLAPDGYSFGAHPGNSKDYGFWECEDVVTPPFSYEDFEDFEDDIDELRRQLDDANATNQSLANRMAEKSRELNAIRNENLTLRRQLKDANDTNEFQRAQIHTMEKDLAVLRKSKAWQNDTVHAAQRAMREIQENKRVLYVRSQSESGFTLDLSCDEKDGIDFIFLLNGLLLSGGVSASAGLYAAESWEKIKNMYNVD